MSNAPPANAPYSAADIEVLSSVEAVRRRPGMYIGDVHDGSGLHHLAWELLANAIDEHLAGHCSIIGMQLGADGSLSIEDDGRGIPVADPARIEHVLTLMHGGPTFDGHPRHVHVAHYGVGLAPVNALSEWLELTIWRDGAEHRQRYERGQPVTPLRATAPANRTGTRVTIKPDAQIFGRTDFDAVRLRKKLREVAGVNPGLTTRFSAPGAIERVHRYDDGAAGFIDAMTATRTMVQSRAIRCTGSERDVSVDVAFKWVDRGPSRVHSFANGEPTSDGSHVRGFWRGVLRAVRAHTGRAGLRSAIEPGLVAMVSVLHFDPRFDSPTRSVLANPEVRPMVSRIVETVARAYFAADPELLARVLARPARTLRAVDEAAMGAAPRDPVSKQVYADQLLQRDDPAGEVLALQCAAERETDPDLAFALESHALDLLDSMRSRR